MNPVRKRFKAAPSKSRPDVSSHEALRLPLTPPTGRGDDEGGGRLLTEEDAADSSLVITTEDSREMKAARRRARKRKKRRQTEKDEEAEAAVEVDRQLDQSLESKSKQHNLTTVNVRNIIHEVITNEHVVAMMKAAINETEAAPPFEPKMTRAKFKEVVEKGGVIPAWNISPIKKTCDIKKPPQFVDIPLAEEDSSDEEYHPDEEEDDETAEDTFQESDLESTASSPRGGRLNRLEEDGGSPWQSSRSRDRRLRSVSGSMGPPPPPPKAVPPKAVTDSTFLEKLHAVEEELAVCLEPYQPLSESEDEAGLMACRTRSKRPLRDIPLGRLEAALRAPDITPDMYDSAPEDREWTDWLRGLMSSDMDNEDEGDDEDDPEYNFLADTDEPDLEDYRDDKAVRITKKEVNELMEELFETLKDDLTGQEVEDEGHEEEEETPAVQTHTPEEQPVDIVQSTPIGGTLTVKQQLALLRQRRHTHAMCGTHTLVAEPYTPKLDGQQKARLQQQLQQHVQLLTQIHLLTSPVVRLHGEAETTKQFLSELGALARGAELLASPARPGFRSVFGASNLQGALRLLEELQQTPISYRPRRHPPDARGYVRRYPVMPAELAWLFATRPVFLYPELLPCASLDPALYCPRRTSAFTAAEDCLLVLGLRNMEGSRDPAKLVSQFLLRKTLVQVRRRVLQCCRPGFPDNVVKVFRYQRVLGHMPVACSRVDPADQRPPVEREQRRMPLWLLRSLPVIYPIIKCYNSSAGSAPEDPPPCRGAHPRQSHPTFLGSPSGTYSFPPGTRYPPRVPKHLEFRRIGFVLLHPPLPPPSLYVSPLSDKPMNPSPPPSPPPPLLQKSCSPPKDPCTADIFSVGTATTERIRCHYLTLAGLRRRTLNEWPNPSQVEVGDEEEEESDVLLALSESSSSAAGSVAHDDDSPDNSADDTEAEECDDDDDDGGTSSDESRLSLLQLQRKRSSEETEDKQRESEDLAFAQDYLHRVCDAAQASPGLSERLLRVLDGFSAAGSHGAPERLYERLSRELRPWPQLLRDFAAFLNQEQAGRCGLLLEQQLFDRSRQFLRLLGYSLGESSSLYQQVVSVLQGSSTPLPEDLEKVSTLLGHHPNLQKEFREFFHHLQVPMSEGSSVDMQMNSVSQMLPETTRKGVGKNKDDDEEDENMITNKEKVTWTREADRAILTACRQRGANRKTFRQVSAQLGNKTTRQVSTRFHDLMNLFHSTSQKSASCSLEGQSVNRQEAAPD